MKIRKIFTLIIACMLAILPIGILSACCGKTKQAPTYKGMEISKNSVSATALMGEGGVENWQPGEFYGDTIVRNENAPLNNPFSNNSDVEDYVGTLDVVEPAKEIYCAEKNEEIILTIKFSNPDKLNIDSFTINDEKYTSQNFENNSDFENIKLKLNVGNKAGIIDFTIDEIKYIDGNTTKDVVIEGDKTVRAGIREDGMVNATVSQFKVGLDNMSMDVNLEDSYNLIDTKVNKPVVMLYNGETILEKKEIAVGVQGVTFSNLTPNTLYQVAIVAVYDDLQGDGTQAYLLFKKTFYTNAIVLFEVPTITQTSASWGYVWDENMTNKTITKLELFLDNAKVKDLETNATSVDKLYSNRQYQICATYKNQSNIDEKIYLNFVTKAKTEPTIMLKTTEVTADSISFDYDLIDVEGIAQINKFKILKNGVMKTEIGANDLKKFTGLDVYSEYEIVAEYSYNLNDGAGVQNKTTSILVRTKFKTGITSIRVTNTNVGAFSEGDTINFAIQIENVENAKVKKVVINHVEYTPLDISNGNDVYVNILVDGQFEGGQTTFTLSEIVVEVDGEDVAYSAFGNTTASVFINGSLEVTEFSLGDAEGNLFEDGDYIAENSELYGYITLKNKTGYTIDSIKASYNGKLNYAQEYTTIEKVENSNEKIKVNFGAVDYGFRDSSKIFSIKYHNQYIESKEIEAEMQINNSVFVYRDIVEIKTKEDFLNFNSKENYYLYVMKFMDDIDLTGYDITGVQCYVVDGNNHTIKNASCVKTFENADAEVGVLNADLIVKDLNIENINFNITLNSTDSQAYDAEISILGYPEIVKNVNVSGVANITNTTGGKNHIGYATGIPYNGLTSQIFKYEEIASYGYYEGSLKAIVVSDKVKKIKEHAFDRSNLSSFNFTEKITEIGEYAFASTKLQSADLRYVEKIGDYCFRYSDLEFVELSDKLTEIGLGTFYSTELKSIDLKNIEKIGDECFLYCDKLEHVDMSDKIKELGSQVFYDTALKLIDLTNVEKISYYTFSTYSCKTIIMPKYLEDNNFEFLWPLQYNIEIVINYDYNLRHFESYYNYPGISKIKVLKTVYDNYNPTENYAKNELENASHFTKTEEGGYYVFVRV